jgi:cell division protease FtsH
VGAGHCVRRAFTGRAALARRADRSGQAGPHRERHAARCGRPAGRQLRPGQPAPPAGPAPVGDAAASGRFHTDLPSSGPLTAELYRTLSAGKAAVQVDKQPFKQQLRLVTTFLLPLLVLATVFAILLSPGGRGAAIGGIVDFSTVRGGRVKEGAATSVGFGSAGGVDEAVVELQEVVDYLRDPTKYEAMGAAPPKGLLLFGPPGCGKTLLAKAVAGEAGVPFFSVAGAEFVEALVGIGAARVRDLFARVRAAAPAIVFIDELDAAGRKRGSGGGSGGSDEREQTLNQLLVEMDGFDASKGIVVIGATNRPDILDPALRRPGRFDRHITIDRPDPEGRLKILQIHAAGKPLADDVDLQRIAERTPGFTGADLANVVNEAALLTIRDGRPQLTGGDLLEAIRRVLEGPKRKGHLLTDAEKDRAAHHEAGHVIVSLALGQPQPLQRVSILGGGRAIATTELKPDDEEQVLNEDQLRSRLAVRLAGPAAEQLVYAGISTGVERDLEEATATARDMVARYGMATGLEFMRLLGGRQRGLPRRRDTLGRHRRGHQVRGGQRNPGIAARGSRHRARRPGEASCGAGPGRGRAPGARDPGGGRAARRAGTRRRGHEDPAIRSVPTADAADGRLMPRGVLLPPPRWRWVRLAMALALLAASTGALGVTGAQAAAMTCGPGGTVEDIGNGWLSSSPTYPDGVQATRLVAAAIFDTNLIYATNGTVVMRSLDAGCGWSAVYKAEAPQSAVPGTDVTITALHAPSSANSSSHVYVGVTTTTQGVSMPAVAVSSDRGESFRTTDLDQGLDAVGKVTEIAASPTIPQIAYVALSTRVSELSTSAIFGTSDAGSSWTKRTGTAGSPPTDLVVDPLGQTNIFGLAAGRVVRSANGAATFSDVAGNPGGTVTGLTAAPGAGGLRLAAARPDVSGIATSIDGGGTWRTVRSPVRLGSLAVAPLQDMFGVAADEQVVLVEASRPGQPVTVSPASPGSFGSLTLTAPTGAGFAAVGVRKGAVARLSVSNSLVPVPLPGGGQLGGRLRPVQLQPSGPLAQFPSTLLPTALSVSLPAGGSRVVPYDLLVPRTPTPVDVMFLVDSTGSMSSVIEELRVRLAEIVNTLDNAGLNIRFGIADYRDYPSPYGSAGLDDWPYRLRRAVGPGEQSAAGRDRQHRGGWGNQRRQGVPADGADAGCNGSRRRLRRGRSRRPPRLRGARAGRSLPSRCAEARDGCRGHGGPLRW